MSKKPFFQKINYQLWSRKWWPISAYWSTTIEKKANTNTKTKQESHIEPKNAKTAQYKNIAVKKQRYRIISDYGKHFPKKNKNAKKNRKPQKPHQKKSTKIRSKKKNSRNYHLQNMKQNINLTKFTTTDLKQINTEFKLYTKRHNIKKNK